MSISKSPTELYSVEDEAMPESTLLATPESSLSLSEGRPLFAGDPLEQPEPASAPIKSFE
jgi:hypothetical protein